VQLEIEDHGVGISAGEQARIFERFYRVQNSAEAAPGRESRPRGASQVARRAPHPAEAAGRRADREHLRRVS
jgi:hypothetical protein